MSGERLPEIFSRNVPGSTEKLMKRSVGIAGCGGLGSNAAAALVRAGIGKLVIADHDDVEESNLNRQYYFRKDIGRAKVDVLSARLKEINPSVEVETHSIELSPGDIAGVFASADLLIEAFDRADNKHWLIEAWCRAFPDRPIVCASGVSGLGKSETIGVRSSGRIHVVGDEQSDSSIGLCSARVAIVANMQANVALEILTGGRD